MLGVDRKVFDNDVNTEGSSMLFEDNSFYEMTQEPSLDDETTWLEGEECEDLFGITNMNSNESIYYECQYFVRADAADIGQSGDRLREGSASQGDISISESALSDGNK